MSAFIQLTKINFDEERPAPALVVSDRPIDVTTDTDDVGENEGASLAVVAEQPSVPSQPASEPVVIGTSAIRCFYQRRRAKGPGTRLTFIDGGGFAVKESYDEVLAKIRSVTDAVA